MDSLKSRLLAFLSLVLVVILWFELDWFNHNIYKHKPWIEVIEPEHIDTGVDWIFGFFIVSVGVAFTRGKLQLLMEPSKFLGKDYFNFLSRRGTAIVFGCLVAMVFGIIVFNPAVHLDYVAGGEKPMVIHKGSPQYFNGTTIFLDLDPTELRNQNIEIMDRRGLYRIKLAPSDVSHTALLFPKHARVDLRKFFIRRDFKAKLSAGNDRDLGSFKFSYESTDSLGKQCADSEPGFMKHCPGLGNLDTEVGN